VLPLIAAWSSGLSQSRGRPKLDLSPPVVALAPAILVILPVLFSWHLPLVDAPAHEAHLAVLRDLLITRRGSAFYEFDTFFLPNIAFEIIGLGLTAITDPETAGRVFFGATLILTLWGVVLLSRVVVGRWTVVVPITGALLVYNWVSVFGFLNYAFGFALVPWALSARLILERRNQALGIFLSAGFGLVLLFCHVFAFAIYATMSIGSALEALIHRRLRVGEAAVWALEVIPAVLVFLSMSTITQGRFTYFYESSYIYRKLLEIPKSITSASIIGDMACLTGAILLLILLVVYSRVRLARPMVPGLIVLALLYFVLPFELAAGDYADTRMPIAIALLSLAGLEIRTFRSPATAMLICLMVATLIVKQIALVALRRSFDPWIDSLVTSLERLPAGSVIMQAECEPQAK
jgi:hypothetical protein